MPPVPPFGEVASVRVMPCRVEIRLGNTVAARDVLGLPSAPENVGHHGRLS